MGFFHLIVVILAELECRINPAGCGRQQLGLIEITESTLLQYRVIVGSDPPASKLTDWPLQAVNNVVGQDVLVVVIPSGWGRDLVRSAHGRRAVVTRDDEPFLVTRSGLWLSLV